MSAARNVYIGQEMERTEDFRFLTGRGTFVDDYEPAGLLHAAILRSTVPHGRITSIDASAALKMPGVHAVITAPDIGATIPRIPIRLAPIAGLEKYLQPVIAVEKVRYVGEPLAVILADSRAIGEDAAAEINVTIEPLAPVSDWRASEADTSLLFEENGSN
ncbi:MAG: xanthine dehydrogenase family protein molybdopterin-binding subunit, partial [Pseudolabrys sp.]